MTRENLRDDSVDQEVASNIIDDRKTIEERAKYAGIISQYKSDHRYDPKSVESGYMQGATEQKDIDVKKAKDAFDKACGWLSTYAWYNAVVEEFIKNMEE